MFCRFCGKNIPSTSTVCPSCGENVKEVSRPATQVQMVSVQSEKNLGLGLALAFLAGPLGLLYSSVKWACILIALNVIMLLIGFGSCASSIGSKSPDAAATGAFGIILVWIVPILSWIASMVLSWYAISEYNNNVRRGIANSDVN